MAQTSLRNLYRDGHANLQVRNQVTRYALGTTDTERRYRNGMWENNAYVASHVCAMLCNFNPIIAVTLLIISEQRRARTTN